MTTGPKVGPHNFLEARVWLEQAFKVGDEPELKLQALDDPDLAPLWSAKG